MYIYMYTHTYDWALKRVLGFVKQLCEMDSDFWAGDKGQAR